MVLQGQDAWRKHPSLVRGVRAAWFRGPETLAVVLGFTAVSYAGKAMGLWGGGHGHGHGHGGHGHGGHASSYASDKTGEAH